jgi:hypothetical protein
VEQKYNREMPRNFRARTDAPYIIDNMKFMQGKLLLANITR